MDHCRPAGDASKSRRSEGSAMFTIVLSSPTMSRLIEQIPSTANLRFLLSSTSTIGRITSGADVGSAPLAAPGANCLAYSN
ncbi:hypothetical protein ACG83_23640 [Frankia sp. R43]|nr:hypothetical protein ACG83_23640 [Frankia sp. R43]